MGGNAVSSPRRMGFTGGCGYGYGDPVVGFVRAGNVEAVMSERKVRWADVFYRAVVVGVAIDVVWRWRKAIYWGVAGILTYRVLLGVGLAVAVVAVGWQPVVAATYPGGTRIPEEWYYCHASKYTAGQGTVSLTAVNWTDIECEHILWQQPGGVGGGAESVLFQGSVDVVGVNDAHEAGLLRGWIMPARGIKGYTYSCDMFVTVCNVAGSGSFAGNAASDINSGWTGTEGNVLWPSPSSGNCLTNDLDLVASVSSSTYDNWWSSTLVEGWNVAAANTADGGVDYSADGSTINDGRTVASGYSCQIIGWDDWPAWLATNPPWWPGDGDWVSVPATPTPVVTPGEWSAEPWVPVTSTVNAPNFTLGPPVDGGCNVVVPGYSYTWFSEVYGWGGITICTSDYALSLGMFGLDMNYLINIWIFLGGLGILVSILKRA